MLNFPRELFCAQSKPVHHWLLVELWAELANHSEASCLQADLTIDFLFLEVECWAKLGAVSKYQPES